MFGYELSKESAGGPPKYAFTMTSIQKLGINPSSGFNTPLAIYAYPVTPMMVTHLTGGKNMDIALNMPEIEGELPKYADTDWELPFVANAPFINFFGYKDLSTVYFTSVGMDDAKYRAVIDRLERWFREDSGLTLSNPARQFRQLLIQAQKHNKIAVDRAPKSSAEISDYERLATVWTLTRAISHVTVAADFDEAQAVGGAVNQSTISLWRSLLIMLGITVVVDDAGKSLIHKNEPEQVAVLDSRNIEPLRQFDNVTRAGKDRSDPDVYWKRNPQQAKALIDEKTNAIRSLISRMNSESFDADKEFTDIMYTISGVGNHAFLRGKIKGIIKSEGLDAPLAEFLKKMIPSTTDEEIIAFSSALVYAYNLTGDEQIIDVIVNRLAAKKSIFFITLKRFVERDNAVDNTDREFIFKLCQKAFDIGKNLDGQDPQDAETMLFSLAKKFASKNEESNFMSMSYFMQLALPLIRSLPPEIRDQSRHPLSHDPMTLADALRSVFGDVEQHAATRRERTQILTLQQKSTHRPETYGLYANLGDLDLLRNRLQQILTDSRNEINIAQKIVDSEHNFVRKGSRLDVDDYRFGPGHFIQHTIQSATPEQLQQVNAIWDSYTKKIRAALRGPNYLQMLEDIKGNNPDMSEDEFNKLSVDYLRNFASKQLVALRDAVDTLETEMTAQLESMDDKSVDTTPLYERLIKRWL